MDNKTDLLIAVNTRRRHKIRFARDSKVKGSLAARKFWPRIALMQNFFVKSLAEKNSMKTGLREVTQKL